MIPTPAPPETEPELPMPEAAFRVGNFHGIRPAGNDAEIPVYLARCILAGPNDLLVHTHRILLACARNNADEVFAALVDLFIATGGRKRALKKRLLNECAPLLSPQQHQFLDKHRRTGLTAATRVSSMLTVLTSGAGRGAIFAEHP
jgi:hypothetical protein